MDTFYDTAAEHPKAAAHAAALRNLHSLLPVLKPVSRKWLATQANVSERMITAVPNEHKTPAFALAHTLTDIAHAVQQAKGDLAQPTTAFRRRAS